ncbi:MAG: hypothetical protein V1696_01740 [Candidatus Jorgensenbacteria bacterium]
MEPLPAGQIRKDLLIIVVSVLVAWFLAASGLIAELLGTLGGMALVGSFVAGMFYTSIFTVAPATVVLGSLAREHSLLPVALLGGLGALVGDTVIFRFVRDRLVDDFLHLIRQSPAERLATVFRRRHFRWLLQFIGALVVASPLPDELGLAMMGLSKMRMSLFVPVSFVMNSAGILLVGLVARAL